MYATQPKINTALLLTLKTTTLVNVNTWHGYEYPISGDALTLLTAPSYTSKSIWEGVGAK